MRGTVKWFSAEKRYGFIAVPGDKDVFFHAKALVGCREVADGAAVEFETETSERGLRARSVRPLDA